MPGRLLLALVWFLNRDGFMPHRGGGVGTRVGMDSWLVSDSTTMVTAFRGSKVMCRTRNSFPFTDRYYVIVW